MGQGQYWSLGLHCTSRRWTSTWKVANSPLSGMNVHPFTPALAQIPLGTSAIMLPWPASVDFIDPLMQRQG